MTNEEVIELARQAWISDKEAQLITEFDEAYISCTYVTDLKAFAKLVAEKEREACAEIAEKERHNTIMLMSLPAQSSAAFNIYNRIKARGEA